jgi:hypothetical protein
MEFAVPHGTARHTGSAAHRCPRCREQALMLDRRHVSPARLGPALVTEYWDCDCCDARFQFSPAENRWRPVYH